jgi:hypothetical protein
MSLGDKIPVEPLGDARWDKIERGLMERDRSPVLLDAPRRWPIYAAFAAAAAVIVFLAARPRSATNRIVTAPPIAVSTPHGGASTIDLGDAQIAFGEAANATIERHGEIDVTLGEGIVECEVAPRAGRPPFKVIAGATTVTVVGTHFTVERHGDSVRVAVARGKVRVDAPDGQHFVPAGESLQVGPPPPAPPAPPVPSASVRDGGVADAPKGPSRGKQLSVIEGEQHDDPRSAYGRLLELAKGEDAVGARALYDAETLANGALKKPDAAILASKEYERRFPDGKDAAPAFAVRIEAYLQTGDRAAAQSAAEVFLKKYPTDEHVGRAREVAGWPRKP